MLENIEDDEQFDWLNHTDSNLSCEEVSFSKDNNIATTEGNIYVCCVRTYTLYMFNA